MRLHGNVIDCDAASSKISFDHVKPRRDGDKFCKILNSHFFHYSLTVSLDGALCGSELRDLLHELQVQRPAARGVSERRGGRGGSGFVVHVDERRWEVGC